MGLTCPQCNQLFAEGIAFCPADGCRLHSAEERRGDPLIGKIFDGRYQVLRKLGAGGMGAVYVARQISVGRDVALKVLLPGPCRSEKADQRFLREAQAASMLRNPHTVVLFDFGSSDDGLFLVMELLEGRSLAQLLREEERLPLPRAMRLLRQICDSLAEAHAKGLVHRDLKPDNVFLLQSEGSPDFVKVLDFGIAKRLDESPEQALTTEGQVLGTAAYLAPEVAMGRTVTPAADIYALGVLLFEMLAGQRPFRAETPSALLIAHVQDPVPRLSEAGLAACPPELQRFVERLMAKDPAARPASVLEVKRQCQEVLVEPSEWSGKRDEEGEEPTLGLSALPGEEDEATSAESTLSQRLLAWSYAPSPPSAAPVAAPAPPASASPPLPAVALPGQRSQALAGGAVALLLVAGLVTWALARRATDPLPGPAPIQAPQPEQ
ncbi:MAG: serine/threonine protein kinase, partial [Deltaproteobacteria bacterium]|nr:serine/threonine protein kinase [Deltaproteobacteria bacterium]